MTRTPPPAFRDGTETCKPLLSTLKAARNLCSKRHVRLYGGGLPKVFPTGSNISQVSIDDLLDWSTYT